MADKPPVGGLRIWLQLLLKSLLAMLILFLLLSLLGSHKTEAAEASQTLQLSAGKTQQWHFATGVAPGQQLYLAGENRGRDSARLLIRVDPAGSDGYFSRFNREQLLPPGPFRLRLSLDALQTERKQRFGATQIRQLLLSSLQGDLHWQTVRLEPLPQLPAPLTGWDFGPADQPQAPGFTPVSIPLSAADKASGITLSGPVRSRNRPYFDAALADGAEGLTRLSLPLDNGLWQIQLWVDDIGEWEYLPHALERSVTVNGQPLLQDKLSPQQWLKRFYLQPETVPAPPHNHADSPAHLKALQLNFWQQIARHRGRPLILTTRVSNKRLQLDFASPDSAGRFISALLVAPVNSPQQRKAADNAFAAYEQQRLQRFQEHWPVIANSEPEQHLPARYQPGTLLHLADQEAVTLHLQIPADAGALTGVQLPLKQLRLYRVFTALRRAGGQEQALQPQLFLQPVTQPESVKQTEQKQQPEQTTPQQWIVTGRFSRADAERLSAKGLNSALLFQNATVPVAIKPLNLRLPAANKPVGIYLDYAPHLSWFADQRTAQQQADCDYRLLHQLGLTGVAPALPTPLPGQENAFKQAAQSPLLAGLLPPFPAYTPVKRLLRDDSAEQRRQAVVQLDKLRSTFDYLLWSLADEPGLHPASDRKLQLLNRDLQQLLPQAQTLAQLNHRHHDRQSRDYNSVLINQGYGLSQTRLNRLQQAGVGVYLYNLPRLRLASGLYLWRSGAHGFWQWHGRMPTAHPYDPTDGREDDVQMLLPTAQVCAEPVIHSALLSIRQGVNDQRWLNWLMQNANQDIDSAILLAELRHQISPDWDANTNKRAFKNNALTLDSMQQIRQLAQAVQSR